MRSVNTIYERIYIKTSTRRTGPPADAPTAGPGAISMQASPPPCPLGADWRLTNAKTRPRGACPIYSRRSSYTKGTAVCRRRVARSVVTFLGRGPVPAGCPCHPITVNGSSRPAGARAWRPRLWHRNGRRARDGRCAARSEWCLRKGWYLTPDSGGPGAASAFTWVRLCSARAPGARGELPAQGRAVGGAWAVCTEESHAEE